MQTGNITFQRTKTTARQLHLKRSTMACLAILRRACLNNCHSLVLHQLNPKRERVAFTLRKYDEPTLRLMLNIHHQCRPAENAANGKDAVTVSNRVRPVRKKVRAKTAYIGTILGRPIEQRTYSSGRGVWSTRKAR